MKNLPISRILATAIRMMVVCVVLTLATSALAQSSHTLANSPEGSRGCSNRTLNGAYGLTLEGTILGPNIPLRGVVMQNFDGNGNITQVDYLVVDGMPVSQDWRPGTGTRTADMRKRQRVLGRRIHNTVTCVTSTGDKREQLTTPSGWGWNETAQAAWL